MKGKKTGGRQKGTPNKENPLKGYLRAHSLAYFEPKPQTDDNGNPRQIEFRNKDGIIFDTIVISNPDGSPRIMSDFDVDMMVLEANERANAELRLLEFHTPKMKSVDVDVTQRTTLTIEDRLKQLCGEEDDSSSNSN